MCHIDYTLFNKRQENWLEAEYPYFSMMTQSENIFILFSFEIFIIQFVYRVFHF